jgi:hypothetical protein
MSVILILVLALQFAIPVSASPQTARNIVITEVEGEDATMTRGRDRSFAARPNQRMGNGYTISTGDASFVWLRLDEDSAVRVDQNSHIQFGNARGNNLSISVLSGALTTNAAAQTPGNSVNVRAGNSALAVRGTLFVVENLPADRAIITMLTGAGEVGDMPLMPGEVMHIYDTAVEQVRENIPLVISEDISAAVLVAIIEHIEDVIEAGALEAEEIAEIITLALDEAVDTSVLEAIIENMENIVEAGVIEAAEANEVVTNIEEIIETREEEAAAPPTPPATAPPPPPWIDEEVPPTTTPPPTQPPGTARQNEVDVTAARLSIGTAAAVLGTATSHNTIEQARSTARSIRNTQVTNYGVGIGIIDRSFTAPIAGTPDNIGGTDGTFEHTVEISRGDATPAHVNHNLNLWAMPYGQPHITTIPALNAALQQGDVTVFRSISVAASLAERIIVPDGRTLTIAGGLSQPIPRGSSAILVESGGRLIVNGQLWQTNNGASMIHIADGAEIVINAAFDFSDTATGPNLTGTIAGPVSFIRENNRWVRSTDAADADNVDIEAARLNIGSVNFGITQWDVNAMMTQDHARTQALSTMRSWANAEFLGVDILISDISFMPPGFDTDGVFEFNLTIGKGLGTQFTFPSPAMMTIFPFEEWSDIWTRTALNQALQAGDVYLRSSVSALTGIPVTVPAGRNLTILNSGFLTISGGRALNIEAGASVSVYGTLNSRPDAALINIADGASLVVNNWNFRDEDGTTPIAPETIIEGPATFIRRGTTPTSTAGHWELLPHPAAQDNADITAARAVIEGATFAAAQGNVANITQAHAAVRAVLNGLNLHGTTTQIINGEFTPAIAGTVANPSGTDGSFTFTVRIDKGIGTQQTTIELTLAIAATEMTQDNLDIAAARAAIEGATFAATQANVGNVAQARAAVQAVLNGLNLHGTTTTIVDGTFIAATAGTSASPNGTNGSFSFTVQINKGTGAQQTTNQMTLTITATAFANEVTVRTEAELRAAVAAAGNATRTIIVAADIYFEQSTVIALPVGANITLITDGQPRSLTRTTPGGAHFMAQQGRTLNIGMANDTTGINDLTLTTNISTIATGTHGGIFLTDATLNMYGGSISGIGGTATVSVFNGSVFNMHSGEIRDNITTIDGGGVSVSERSTFNMHGGTISNNQVITAVGGGVGGGVSVGSQATFNMHGGVISNNQANSSSGGVVVWDATFNMHGGEIVGNEATVHGGGVHVSSGTFNMHGGTISGNVAPIGSAISTGSDNITISGSVNIDGGVVSVPTAVNRTITIAANGVLNVPAGQSLVGGAANRPISILVNPGGQIVGAGNFANTAGTIITGSITGPATFDWNSAQNRWQQVAGGNGNGNGDASVTTETELRTAISSAGNVPITIIIADDIALTQSAGIVLPGGSNITLVTDGQPRNLTQTAQHALHFSVMTGTTLNIGVADDATGINDLTLTTNLSTLATSVQGGIDVNGGTLNMFGGNISGILSNMNVQIGNGGVFNMHGGAIRDNVTMLSGGGVMVAHNGTFNMHDGVISDNIASTGGGVSLAATTAVFNMHGGEITGNQATIAGSGGGGVNTGQGRFTMHGGTISGNTGQLGAYSAIATFSDNITIEGPVNIGGGVESADPARRTITVGAAGVLNVPAGETLVGGAANRPISIRVESGGQIVGVGNFHDTTGALITDEIIGPATFDWNPGENRWQQAVDTTAQDNADITAARSAIEGATFAATQANVGNINQARAAVQNVLNVLNLHGTTTTIVDGTFTPATAGTSALPNGINGSFTFTVQINKGTGATNHKPNDADDYGNAACGRNYNCPST